MEAAKVGPGGGLVGPGGGLVGPLEATTPRSGILHLSTFTPTICEIALPSAGAVTLSSAPNAAWKAQVPSAVLRLSIPHVWNDTFARTVVRGLGKGYVWSDDDSRSDDPAIANVYVDGSAVVLPSAPQAPLTGTNYESFRPLIDFPAAGIVQFDFWVPSLAGQASGHPTYGVFIDRDAPVYVYVWPDDSAGNWYLGLDQMEASVNVTDFAFTPDASSWYTAQLIYDEAQNIELRVWKQGEVEPALPNASGQMNDIIGPYWYGFPFIDLYYNAINEDAKIDNFMVWDPALSALNVADIALAPAATLAISPVSERSGTDLVVVNGNVQATSASAAFIPDDVGKTILIGFVAYQIATVTNSTTIQLARVYAEESSSSQTWSISGSGTPPPTIYTVDPNASDFHIYLYTTEVTGLCEWGVAIEETLGQPGTASFVLQDREMIDSLWYENFPQANKVIVVDGIGFPFDNLDIRIEIDGQTIPVFRGTIQRDAIDLPVAFPWRLHKISATDYQREFFGRRLIGCPTGSLWTGPDSDGNFIPIDPRVYLSGSDKNIVKDLMATVWSPAGPTINATTYVGEYISYIDPLIGDPSNPQPPDPSTIGSVLDLLAGLAIPNVQYWLDPAGYLHYIAVPRWWEAPPEGPPSLDLAPMDISDEPDGVTSIGCRNLGYDFDYSNSFYKVYIRGGVGFAYNGGMVDMLGTGWVYGDWGALSGAEISIDVPSSLDGNAKQEAADRAGNAIKGGLLRGHCTVGNERHHVDGWHVGQVVKITDARLPNYMNGRYYVIQKVSTKLIPFVNWRVYDLEWGDAPIARSSSRRTPKERKVELPGRLWDISGRIQNPLPSSTVTIVGQLVDDKGEPRRVPGVSVDLELHVWDDTGTPAVGVGSISPTTVVTDGMGRWETQMTVGSDLGYYYCVCPVGSGSCVLPT